MKFSHQTPMKFALVLLSALFAAGVVHAEEKKPAERLLEISGFEQLGGDTALTMVKPVIDSFRAQGIPEPGLAELEQAMKAFFTRVMKDPEIKSETVKLYESKFTKQELEQLLAFYETPLGRKSLKELPQLMQDGALIGQKVAQKHTPELEKQIRAIVEKYKPAAAPEGE